MVLPCLEGKNDGIQSTPTQTTTNPAKTFFFNVAKFLFI